jgi:hypothetical protein
MSLVNWLEKVRRAVVRNILKPAHPRRAVSSVGASSAARSQRTLVETVKARVLIPARSFDDMNHPSSVTVSQLGAMVSSHETIDGACEVTSAQTQSLVIVRTVDERDRAIDQSATGATLANQSTPPTFQPAPSTRRFPRTWWGRGSDWP